MNINKIVIGFILILMSLSSVSCEKWYSDTNIIIGLGDIGSFSTPSIFQKDETWYLISGNNDGLWDGWNWTGSAWQPDNDIINGLIDVGEYAKPSIFQKDETWYLISGNGDGLWYGWNWTGSAWQPDNDIINGLTDVGLHSAPSIFQKNSIWYLISGNWSGQSSGFNWTGSAWQSDNNIINGLTDVGDVSTPNIFYKNNNWYLINGNYTGIFTGFLWNDTLWENNVMIVSGINDIGASTISSTFQKHGIWYLIAGDSTGIFQGFINTYDNKTGIWGNVYEGTTGIDNPLSDVNVYIYNNTWSDTTVTDSNGVYEFINLENTTYTLNFKKDRYKEVLYQYTTPTNLSMSYKVIYMQKSTGEYYSRHYATFTLKNLLQTRYQNVDAVVYDNGNIESSGVTGIDGSIVFHLFEDIEYRITFINATQSINKEITLYPRDNEYTIYVSDYDFSPEDSERGDTINWWYQKGDLNLTHQYLNFSYRDTANATTSIKYWINDSDNENLYYFTQAYPCPAGAAYEVNQIVNSSNHTYIVHFSATHPDYPELENSAIQTISYYTGKLIDLAFTEQWHYTVTAICIIIFIAMFFGATNVGTGSVIICLSAWFFSYIAWLPTSTIGYASLVLATILSVAFAMRKAEVIHT